MQQLTNSEVPCDREPNELATVVVLTRSGPLCFCDHHFRQHTRALLARGYPAAELAGQMFGPVAEPARA